MAIQPGAPVLIKPIPSQIVNEGATFGPLRLAEFIQSPDREVTFTAEIEEGKPLPTGLICTQDGMINGIPAANTKGHYKVTIVAEDDFGRRLETDFDFTIKERISIENPEFLQKLKTQVWEALGKNLPIPEIGDIMNRPVSAAEIYYLLQRFATLTIWDVYNLEYPTEKKLLTLPGASKHYHIYDRGSCLIAAPIELFSHERTLEDALQTSRAMAKEVYSRGWVIEFAGFNKMVRAAWVELQLLGDKQGKQLEILHYSPSAEDLEIYTLESKAQGAAPSA